MNVNVLNLFIFHKYKCYLVTYSSIFVRPFYNENNFCEMSCAFPTRRSPSKQRYTLRAANNVPLRRDAKYKLHLSVAVPKSACILINVE